MESQLPHLSAVSRKGKKYECSTGSISRNSDLKTRAELDQYLGGSTIACLLCNRRFQRLAFHLHAKHGLTVDEYNAIFGIPSSRGLTCKPSRARSGWTDQRNAQVRQRAKKLKFFGSSVLRAEKKTQGRAARDRRGRRHA